MGIAVAFEELVSLGVINYSVTRGDFIDREMANLFLYEFTQSMAAFVLQLEEVAGIGKVDVKEFRACFRGKQDGVDMVGFQYNDQGEKMMIREFVNKSNFVPHGDAYYEQIINMMDNYLKMKLEKHSP